MCYTLFKGGKMKKIFLLILGMFLIALGTVINTKTNLGNSAIGSLPFILSKLSNVSLGLMTNIVYATFIILQILILKGITKQIILQIPITILFGFLIDLINYFWFIDVDNLYVSFILLFLSISFISFGMFIVLKLNLVYNTPDGLVKAMSTKFKLKNGTSKNLLDFIVVMISIIISLINFKSLQGVGIGTIMAVIFIGRFISLWEKLGGKIC